MHKTRIVATLGPGTESVDRIYELIMAGMDVARINLSHGDRASHQQAIANVKAAREKAGTPTAILLDNRGPEIRVCEMAEPLQLAAGEELVLVGDNTFHSAAKIGCNYSGIADDVSIGEHILLDDGKIILEVNAIKNDEIFCTIRNSGELSSRKRVALPESIVNLPALSDKDIEDIGFGVEQQVDFIAASFIRKAADVHEVRRLIEKHGGNLAIISKIENQQGVDNVVEILAASDGMMIARGDLGVELPAEQVPMIQKKIIRMANEAGKPVITATQMLESMITHPTPTRAEASDVTNAIFDGTDAVMLSAETAVGRYPVEAVQFLVRCAESAEAAMDYDALLAAGLSYRKKTITDSISYACCASAQDLDAQAIITATTSGSTARMVSRYHPRPPIIAVSTNGSRLRQLQVVRGVTALPGSRASGMDEQLDICVQTAQQAGLVKNGDLVVITAGMPLGIVGSTNMIKVRTVADICLRGQPGAPGFVEGLVRIIRSEADWENLPEKAIVVVEKSDDSIAEKLSGAVGIITEESGADSHAVTAGRDLNIAVVAGVADAISSLENDQMVTIDGSSGQVSYGRASI